MVKKANYLALKSITDANNVKLAAVSKTHDVKTIKQVYDLGQRIFAENKAQELSEKQPELPNDIEWHFVGHLQRNKVKYIAPFVNLIHSFDSFKLVKEIDKEAAKNNRVINGLLQIHISQDESKYGFSYEQAKEFLDTKALWDLNNIRISGLMGIATLTEDKSLIRKEFQELKAFYDELKVNYFQEASHFKEVSMGMTSDYDIAMEEGSTIIRVGSYIFGERNYG